MKRGLSAIATSVSSEVPFSESPVTTALSVGETRVALSQWAVRILLVAGEAPQQAPAMAGCPDQRRTTPKRRAKIVVLRICVCLSISTGSLPQYRHLKWCRHPEKTGAKWRKMPVRGILGSPGTIRHPPWGPSTHYDDGSGRRVPYLGRSLKSKVPVP